MAELLLELFSEEIPARMQKRAAEDLKSLVVEGLRAGGLEEGTAKAFVTPRRLTLVIDDLPVATPDVREERRGPKADAPAKAIEGFLAGNGVTLEQCEKRETPKGTFLFAIVEKKGQKTADLLVSVINEALTKLPWPKSMRWAAHGTTRWVRPLHRIVALFDGAVVPVSFGPVVAGDTTQGHRFLAPAPFSVTGFDDYRAKLRAAKVILDAAERREMIVNGARRLAAAEGLTLKEDQGLADEVSGLVEWPVVLMGRIDDAFMDVPAETLITAMRTHQKYFSLLDADGKMAARFIVVSNQEAADGGKAIVAGNERVLRARLSDAKFFWDNDREKTLESRLPKLEEIVFNAKFGDAAGKMSHKAQRIAKLAGVLASKVGADAALAERAGKLAKADLVSEMVFEFPELQGIAGRYYALHDGEDPVVAEAIAKHYSPAGPADDCPTDPVAVAVALADKIDTLVGFWAIDEKPTGSKDPFALRRAALGVIRIILENGLRLHLIEIFEMCLSELRPFLGGAGGQQSAQAGKGLQASISPGTASVVTLHCYPGWTREIDDVAMSLLSFFADRLKVHLKEQGLRHDLITAVFALGGEDDLVRLVARVRALGDFLDSDDGANLLIAYRRASNIVGIEEKKDGKTYDGAADKGLLDQAEEKALFDRLGEVEQQTKDALGREDFAGGMACVARLRGPVDAFFDKVTVNCDEPGTRANRLRLLSRIRQALGGVADFSKIEG